MPKSANQNALRTNGCFDCIVHIRVHPFWVVNNLNITDHLATDIALRAKGSRPTAIFKSSNFTHPFLSSTDLRKNSDTLRVQKRPSDCVLPAMLPRSIFLCMSAFLATTTTYAALEAKGYVRSASNDPVCT